MVIKSDAFGEYESIPEKYTCTDQNYNVNPPLSIQEPPEGTQSFVLIIDDPDAPMGTWDHWIVYNIDPQTTSIDEGTVPTHAIQVVNSFGFENYGGPCPPYGEEHRYFFKLFALNTKLAEDGIYNKQQLIEAMSGHTLDSSEFVGVYSR